MLQARRPPQAQGDLVRGEPGRPLARLRPTTSIVARDKASLDIFWLRDESLEDSANLPDPHILAAEIADDLESALEQIRDILGDLEERVNDGPLSKGGNG